MTDEQQEQIDGWDPDAEMTKMNKKGVKIPVVFKREDAEVPSMVMEFKEPPEKIITITAKPTIINIGRKNKNALW